MYAGKFVFVQKVRDPNVDSRNHSTYEDGEYFILRESLSCLYGVRPVTGYEFSRCISLATVGSAKFEIVSYYNDSVAAADIARLNLEWVARETAPGVRKSWVDSVYDSARNNARAVLHAIGVTLPEKVEIVIPQKAVVEIEIKVNGVPLKI